MNNACLICKQQQAHQCLACVAKTVERWRQDRERLGRERTAIEAGVEKVHRENERLRVALQRLEAHGEHPNAPECISRIAKEALAAEQKS